MANPPGATEEETAHQTTLGKKAQGTETPDYPEYPAPPHSEAPQQQWVQQLTGPLETPPPGQRPPHKNPHVAPSYQQEIFRQGNYDPRGYYPDTYSSQ